MRYLLDTGIIARLPHRSDPLHSLVCRAIRELGVRHHAFCTSTQNIAEFWNLCTRPNDARGGFGLSVADAHRRLAIIERVVAVLKEPPSAYERWKLLVVTHQVRGKQVHDARIAALMSAYRIKRILTLNASDFARYGGIEAVTPREVLQAIDR